LRAEEKGGRAEKSSWGLEGPLLGKAKTNYRLWAGVAIYQLSVFLGENGCSATSSWGKYLLGHL